MSKEKKIFLSFAVLILFIYGQSLAGGFVFDDRGIQEHMVLLDKVENVLQVAAYPYWTEDAGLYRPTSLLSYWANIVFLGGSAFSFHFINLFLYFGICILIYLVLRKLFKKDWLAYLAALIFLVLPIHTEVVANITGRLELLALFFSLLTLWEFTKERVNPWLVGFYVLLALGSKEVAIAVVPLVFLLVLIKKEKLISHKTLAVVGGAVLYFFLRFLVLGPEHFLGVETSVIENPLLFASAAERVYTALGIFSMYLWKTFIPLNLCSDYSYNQISTLTTLWNLKSLAGLAALLASGLGICFWRKWPIIAFASGTFLLGFITVSNIFFPIGTIAGERLFFFPSLGLVILVAYILTQKKFLLWIVIAGVAMYALLSFHRQSVWLTEERLFINAAQCSPKSVLSLSNLGTVYYFRGDYEKAEEVLLASKAIKPVYSKGLNNLGLVYWKQGRFAEAENLYHEALKQRYPYPGAYENIILLKLSKGDKEGALRWLRIVYPNVDDSVLRSQF